MEFPRRLRYHWRLIRKTSPNPMDSPGFPTPQDAEAAFYTALERADLAAMMAVWADDEDIVCIHPMGPRLRGHASVRQGWQKLFAGGGRMHFQLGETQRFQGSLLAIHVVQENILLRDDPKPRPPLVATNVYQLTGRGWRMILHHASPAPGAPQDPPARPPLLH